MLAKTANGHVTEAVTSQNGAKRSKSKGTMRWMMISIVRLFIWYILLTPFFRCPSSVSDLNDSSPRVCRPYLIARSQVEPHISPYYNKYAAYYVEQARPYVETFNQEVYVPASNIAKSGYDRYGAPAWQQAQAYVAAQWKARVSPQIQAARKQIHEFYMARIGSYVEQGIAAASPYYRRANDVASAVYWNHLVPFYTRSQPFIGKTYSAGHDILTTHVMPGARYTWSSVVYFVNSSLWPQITGFYSEQVEPQLVKIGQRLASYREGKRLRSVLEDMESTSHSYISSTTFVSEQPDPTLNNPSTTTTMEHYSTQPTLSSEEQGKQARERIASDLQRWHEKFAVAADKGIEDLEERLEEIVSALIASSANSHGQSLSTALQTIATQQVTVIKSRIDELARSLPEEDAPEAEETARNELVSDIRNSAILVRDRAHALREWSHAFDAELTRRVSAAVNSTLDVLDSIRDLGLQEIGMRWAWMDGVTYKDWARYHALKAQLEDWRNEIYKVGMNHKSVAEAKAAVTRIMDDAMEIAEATAKELVRLKDVGHWKIAAREVSDNYDTRTEPPPPRSKPVEENIESVERPDAKDDESIEKHSNEFVPVTAVDDSKDAENQPFAADVDEPTANPYGSTYDPEATVGTSVNLETAEPASSDAFEEKPISVKPAWGVAAAEVNSQQVPIIENDDDRDTIQKLADHVTDRYSAASLAFADSSANAKILYEIAKAQVMGRMAESSAPVHVQLLASIESAYSGAIGYATEQFESRIGAVEATPTPSLAGPLAHISSIASSRLNQGLYLASQQLASIQPTVSPTSSSGMQPFVLDAQRRYYEAVGLAHDHYSAFVSTASEAVFGTPTPTPAPSGFQDLIHEAGSQYERVSSMASASLAAVVASASSAISSADDGRAQAAINDASSRFQAAMSAASSSLSVASVSASSALYGTTPGPFESLSSQASENWEGLVSKASEQIYGTPSPYIQQVVQAQIQQFGAVQDIVSELLVGKQPPFTESVMSRLRSAYETPYPAAVISSASSYATNAFVSASSVANVVMTALPSVDDVVQNAHEQLDAAVEAASIGIYGTPKSYYEQATDAYSTASAQISSAVYGKKPSYVDAAHKAIVEIQNKANAAIYGEEPGAVESATSRLAVAVESAQSRIAAFVSSASSVASEAAETAASDADGFSNSIKAAAASSKDEL